VGQRVSFLVLFDLTRIRKEKSTPLKSRPDLPMFSFAALLCHHYRKEKQSNLDL